MEENQKLDKLKMDISIDQLNRFEIADTKCNVCIHKYEDKPKILRDLLEYENDCGHDSTRRSFKYELIFENDEDFVYWTLRL